MLAGFSDRPDRGTGPEKQQAKLLAGPERVFRTGLIGPVRKTSEHFLLDGPDRSGQTGLTGLGQVIVFWTNLTEPGQAGPDRSGQTGLIGPGQVGSVRIKLYGPIPIRTVQKIRALFARWSGPVRLDRLDRSRSCRSGPNRVF
ncbi:hypothetical protein TIFTF001_016724 [Ficus carica]|uniref:Uncharacterized protein n=1 Tax=Ficus carica TaxID=3494 RepID=A0AA88AAY1_FICCA|nr:hypothetical protein TIFTF001_016724 [Ficus carica]